MGLLRLSALLVAVTAALTTAAQVTPAAAHHSDSGPSAQSGATADLGLTRRADRAIDRYIHTPRRRTPAARMHHSQRVLADRMHALVVHDSDPRVSRNVLGWQKRPRVLVYVNATGVAPWRKAQVHHARKLKLLLRRSGKPVRVHAWLGLDLRKRKARKFWLYGSDGKTTCHRNRDKRAALDLIACGYDGLWLDNVLTDPRQGFKPRPRVSRSSWSRGVLKLLRELRRKLPEGRTIAINTHWTDTEFGWSRRPQLTRSSAHVQAARIADTVVMEGGAIDSGLHYALPESAAWSYRRLLRYADEMHRHGATLQWEKVSSPALAATNLHPRPRLSSCLDRDHRRSWKRGGRAWRAHVQTAAFNAASALLTWQPGDGVGDMCEYPDRGWRGYGLDLGTPVGERVDSRELIVRGFSGGLVAVNPGQHTRSFTLPGGRIGVDLATTAWPIADAPATTFTLKPRSAAVIRYEP